MKANDMRQVPMWAITRLVAVVVVIYGLVGCGNTDATQTSSHPVVTSSSQMDTEQVTLRITGMS